MAITTEQLNQITERVAECVAAVFDSPAARPVITFEIIPGKKMRKVAGYAYPDRKHIELNETLLIENYDAFLAETIPHEVGHILTAMFYPNAKQSHGPEFRKMCAAIGYPSAGRTYNDYSVASVKEGFLYGCQCKGKRFVFSPILHKRMFEGQRRTCNTCEQYVWYTGYQAEVK